MQVSPLWRCQALGGITRTYANSGRASIAENRSQEALKACLALREPEAQVTQAIQREYLPVPPAKLPGSARDGAKPVSFVMATEQLTDLGAAGADAFTMQAVAGHASVTTSQRFTPGS